MFVCFQVLYLWRRRLPRILILTIPFIVVLFINPRQSLMLNWVPGNPGGLQALRTQAKRGSSLRWLRRSWLFCLRLFFPHFVLCRWRVRWQATCAEPCSERQRNEQMNERTKEQTKEQMMEPTNKGTNKGTNKQTKEQSDDAQRQGNHQRFRGHREPIRGKGGGGSNLLKALKE